MSAKGCLLGSILAACVAASALAGYPEKPIQLIIPFPPGGSTGYTAKVLAEALQNETGQPVILEPRPGNFGINAISALTAKTDGYTLMVGSVVTNSMTPVMHQGDFKFDYGAEVVPVTRLAEFPSIAMVDPSAPANSVKEFLETLNRQSRKLVLCADFIGTFSAVDAVMLAKTAGLKVAYHPNPNGATGLLLDLIDGKCNIAFLNVATASANSGKFRPLAVTGNRRLPNFPETPTLAEAGYPGIGISNWQGLFAPRRMPPELLARVFQAAVQAMKEPDTRIAFEKVNAVLMTSESPRSFAGEIDEEMAKWREVKDEVLALPSE